jgi:hypothetical protein
VFALGKTWPEESLPSVGYKALGKGRIFAECRISGTRQIFLFAECRHYGTRQTFLLCRVPESRRSANMPSLPSAGIPTLGKTSVTVSAPSRRYNFAECGLGTRQSLCRVQGTRQSTLCRVFLCRIPFAECNTRQSLCRVFFRFCRVFGTLGKVVVSCSA